MSPHSKRAFVIGLSLTFGALLVADQLSGKAASAQGIAVFDRIAHELLRSLNQEAGRTTSVLRDVEGNLNAIKRSIGVRSDAGQVSVDLTTIGELRKIGPVSQQPVSLDQARSAAVGQFYTTNPQVDQTTKARISAARQKAHQEAAINAYAAAEVVEASTASIAKKMTELAAAASNSSTLLSDGDVQAELQLLIAAQQLAQQHLLVANTKLLATTQIIADDSFVVGGR